MARNNSTVEMLRAFSFAMSNFIMLQRTPRVFDLVKSFLRPGYPHCG